MITFPSLASFLSVISPVNLNSFRTCSSSRNCLRWTILRTSLSAILSSARVADNLGNGLKILLPWHVVQTAYHSRLRELSSSFLYMRCEEDGPSCFRITLGYMKVFFRLMLECSILLKKWWSREPVSSLQQLWCCKATQSMVCRVNLSAGMQPRTRDCGIMNVLHMIWNLGTVVCFKGAGQDYPMT